MCEQRSREMTPRQTALTVTPFYIRAFAAYGARILALQLASAVIDRVANAQLDGIVLLPGDRRLADVAVFIDDGSDSPRTLRTDSAGAFRFDIEPRRLPRARFLICALGAIPMYSEAQSLNTFTPTRYVVESLASDIPPDDYVRGWRGLVPPDCANHSGRAD